MHRLDQRDQRSGKPRRLVGRAVGIAVVALLALGGVAFAAGHFTPKALYTGKSTMCGGAGSMPNTSCSFKFRASASGKSLRDVGASVISVWSCHGGGGEALLGGKADHHEPVPLVRLHANGSLHGSAGAGENKIAVTGHLAQAGKAAVITFHLVNQGCVSPQVTLTAH
jgi:hypothetical protein